MFFTFGAVAYQILLQRMSDVKSLIWKSEQDVLRLNGMCSEQRTVMAERRFPSPRSGEIEVCPLKSVQRIATQGAQQEQGGWAPTIGT